MFSPGRTLKRSLSLLLADFTDYYTITGCAPEEISKNVKFAFALILNMSYPQKDVIYKEYAPCFHPTAYAPAGPVVLSGWVS